MAQRQQMAQKIAARVTCPACQNQFQAPIKQVLDVREDPSAKTRVLNGVVNVAQCPHCGRQGMLNVPFIYHDPEKELALIFMPMEAGRNKEERQRIIGKLTGKVMNQLPSEERKAYLLQPEILLTLENLRKKILKADGITEEMIEEQEAKAELLQRMVETSSEETLEAMIEANDEVIDAVFFQILNNNLQMAQARGQEMDVQRLQGIRDKVMELTSEGQAMQARSEMLEELQEEPERDKLLELLLEAPDERTRELLVSFGRPLMDYLFFQNLTSKVEAAGGKEKERLSELREEILDIRDRIDEATQALYQAKSEFLRDLLTSDNPKELAQRRIEEIDEAFFNVLAANLQEAQKAGNEDAVQALQSIRDMIVEMLEEAMPPGMRLLNQLLTAEDGGKIEEILEDNRELVTERVAQAIEQMEANAREDDKPDVADRMALVAQKMREMI